MEIHGESRNPISLTDFLGFPMPTMVERDDMEPVGERFKLITEHGCRLGPARQHEEGLSFTGFKQVQIGSVGGGDASLPDCNHDRGFLDKEWADLM